MSGDHDKHQVVKPRPAVPLRPVEANELLDSLRVWIRVQQLHGSTYAHTSWVGALIDVVRTDIGTAAALGHPTVPLLVSNLDEVSWALRDLRKMPLTDKQAGMDDQLAQLRAIEHLDTLYAKLRTHAGASLVRGWLLNEDERGRHWGLTVPTVADTAMPQLPTDDGTSEPTR